ncbi:MAG: LPXTG cell wall anchor domain-containing protein [Clostridia bacterium]|nr:LPXTG cell wall anchor domain-containing protein [Clostridia bacterium]
MGDATVLVLGPQQDAHTFNNWRYLSDEQHIRWCQNGFCLKKEKAAHDYTTATCTAKAACKDCGVEIGEVDKNNHTDKVILPAVEPTETKPGWTEGLKCNACGEIIIPQKPVYLPPKTGDGTNPMLWSALALVSLLGAMSVIRKRSKA